MKFTEIIDNKAYRFDYGDWYAAVFVIKHDNDTADGYIIYTGSAYGSAATNDELEEGKPIHLDAKRLEDIEVYAPSDEKYIYDLEYMKKVAEQRRKRVENFITDGKHGFIMQSIDFSMYRNPSTDFVAVRVDLNVGVVSTGFYEYKACAIDERQLLGSCMYISDERTEEEIEESISTREDYLSSCGTILPDTAINVLLENGDVITTTFEKYDTSDFKELLSLNGASDFMMKNVDIVVKSFSRHTLVEICAA